MLPALTGLALVAAVASQESGAPSRGERLSVFRAMLWGDPTESSAAAKRWQAMRLAAGRGVDDPDGAADVVDLEEVLRQGRPTVRRGSGALAERLEVALPDGRVVPVFAATPPGYTHDRAWPVILAMHGGPTGSGEGAVSGAVGMVNVWRDAAAAAGWIVVSPAMVHVRARGPRTEDRLPYEILTPAQAEAILDAVQRRYRIDPDRIVATGISLGANFSIAFAAAMPHRFAAIVPVSAEGDSREHLLRNLQHVPAYVLAGARDRNIRGIEGPRALGSILDRFGYDVTYREFRARAHEGFSELYPEVLRWLDARPRDPYPREILRLPHAGIMPLSRRVFWIESDTRQGIVRVRVRAANHIEIESRWARAITLYLNDYIVDLDRPVAITVNGRRLPPYRPRRSIRVAVDDVRAHGDRGRVATDVVTVGVGTDAESLLRGEALWNDLDPRQPQGPLSFWEFYAVNALGERFPSIGLEGEEVEIDAEMREAVWGRQRLFPGSTPAGSAGEVVGIAITAVDPDGPIGELLPGDVLLEFGDEPFFRGRGGLEALHEWLMRELTGVPRHYRAQVWRDGAGVMLSVEIALGDYLSQ